MTYRELDEARGEGDVARKDCSRINEEAREARTRRREAEDRADEVFHRYKTYHTSTIATASCCCCC
jgi:uncharacterized coiled-coil DUF342 family protein